MKEKKEEKKKKEFEDDGRVIAPMNVDGMPWYDGRKTSDRGKKSENDADDFNYKNLPPEEKKLYRKQTRAIIWGILRYIIPLILVGVAIFGVVIYIMTIIWK